MKKEQIQTLQNAREICDSIAKAITKRNSGQPFCQNYCPGEDCLITIIQQLINAIKDNEPESSTRLAEELQNVKQILPNQCVNPYSFGAIVAIVNILSRKYLNPKGDTRKLFISHSSNDKAIVNGFCDAIVLNSVKPFDKLLNNLDKFSPSTADCVFDESSKYSSFCGLE